ncbi:MAG TPA: RNB domain-containing ribonuclease [Gemmatimonadaceae bacterium]|nr:RNB domain-containing ribonuclease [Gemmatimonadaceae bacterium]
MPDHVASPIEEAFRRLRSELDIPSGFPPEVLAEARQAVAARTPVPLAGRVDRTAIPFVTIDPPGSRDLDQAVHAERAPAGEGASDGGYRLRYAIADVGYWVERGGAIEREAWRRGVTYYAPDRREPLYPPELSEGAASLLPDGDRPAVLFDFRLDARAELRSWSVERAVVRSRAQLTYADLQRWGGSAADGDAPCEPWSETLRLIGEIGPRRLALEAARGGVSLPVRDQHVQRRAATTLGYELVYEEPMEAESWNAQVSLLTGHAAATRMLEAHVGLLRTMPAFDAGDVAKLRRIALTLGFAWPEGESYAEFMHGVRAGHPRVDVLVRQARRVMRGAEYVAFDGAPPEQPLHGALAQVYAHATAPLRRLADRYVLDLVVTLASGGRPTDAEVATLTALVPVMADASRRANQLERRVVDVAEAWSLRGRCGETFPAVVVDVRGDDVEVQVEEPPIRATVRADGAPPPRLGARRRVRLEGVDLEDGRIRLTLAG